MSSTFSADAWSAGGWQRRGHRPTGGRSGSEEHHGGRGHNHDTGHGRGGERGRGREHRQPHAGPPPFLDWLAEAHEGRSRGGRRREGPPGGRGFPDFGDFAEFGRGFADFGRHFGGGPRNRRGPRVGRGDVRAAILLLLAEEPRNGYQIIQELENRSDGVWRPSPGSIYPALSQLEDEGLIEQVAASGDAKRMFRLTEQGRAYVESHTDELKPPWETLTGSVRGGMFELRDLLGQTAFAAIQVARAGSDAQVAAARTLLDETRRGLYRILADGDMPAAQDPQDETDQDAGR